MMLLILIFSTTAILWQSNWTPQVVIVTQKIDSINVIRLIYPLYNLSYFQHSKIIPLQYSKFHPLECQNNIQTIDLFLRLSSALIKRALISFFCLWIISRQCKKTSVTAEWCSYVFFLHRYNFQLLVMR